MPPVPRVVKRREMYKTHSWELEADWQLSWVGHGGGWSEGRTAEDG